MTPPTQATRPPAPALDVDEAAALARTHFGLEGRVRPLASYIDKNFRVDATDGSAWVLKVANEIETEGTLDQQNRVLAELEGALAGSVPRVRKSLRGNDVERVRRKIQSLIDAVRPSRAGPG